ncbi:MAG: hypothetical protein K2W85_09825 [Phycisphaerales bacterium]|nr:hypothetical protein [Phycisphaerales bacterium]
MAEALRRELDPGEDVRWCGQPDPRIIFRRQIPGVLLLSGLLLSISAIFAVVGCSMLQELRGLEPLLDRSQQRPTYGSVYTAFGFAAFIALWILPLTMVPWIMQSVARRTIFAVTRTRVLKVVLSRRGVPTVSAVEPGHPLHLRRKGLEMDKGDIHLYPQPSGKGTSMLTIEAINDARTVERLIRQCFDP